MSTSHCFAALALAIACSAPVAAGATDDFSAAIGGGPTLLGLCGDGGAPLKPAACKEAGLDMLAQQIEKALQTALAKAPANIRPLLKRDQVWFDEVAISAAESVPQSGDSDAQRSYIAGLRQRLTTLEAIAAGFGRSGISGRWASAFGSVVVTPADDGRYGIAIETRSIYGSDDDQRWECKASALLRPASDGWLAGRILQDATKPAQIAGDTAAPDNTRPQPAKTPLVRIRRQGETLRVVTDYREWEEAKLPGCDFSSQITASYFASGKVDVAAATAPVDTAFVLPTFDCARPATASDEEICADPDLATNDLN